MLFIMKDGTVISGTIERETKEYYLVDEDTAFGDIVVINKTDVKSIVNE